MNTKHPEGDFPADPPFGEAAPPAAAAAGADASGSLEEQLARERDARVQMRDRLRHTEALAAESQALRARMAQELERVTRERDRLRSDAAQAGATAAAPMAADTAGAAWPRQDPPLASRQPAAAPLAAADAPLKPPARRRGPWRALAMLGGVAVAGAALAWVTGSLPDPRAWQVASARPSPASAAAPAPGPAAPVVATAAAASPAASADVAALAAPPVPSGAVALPPLSPEAQLAAAPTAAGPAAADPAPAALAARLRAALDGEGIAAPVSIDPASGHVMVADPQADEALRERTDMLIRAAYAGASLPEPRIEHRWLSPMRGERTAAAIADAAPAAQPARLPRAAALVDDRPRQAVATTVADADDLRPVLPAGRVTASCLDGLTGRAGARRGALTACMKRGCCSSAANHNSEECRAYAKAYPFTCGAG